jgi:predicted N-acetyltransferase YhbS
LKQPSIVALILSESEKLLSAIHEINVLAFGQGNEARLVEKLRESCSFGAQLSFVAASLAALTLAPCR